MILPLFLAGALWSGAAAAPKQADRLVLLVFDQMRPDYVERYGLKNFQRLARLGTRFPQAYVGHLGSETVVSHAVIATGLQPKALPWQDNLFLDVKGLVGKAGAAYYFGELDGAQLDRVEGQVPRERFLAERLKRKLGGKVLAAGEKVHSPRLLGTPAADAVVLLRKKGKECVPDGRDVPSYIARSPRFTVPCDSDYGTGGTIRPLDGAHYVPGTDPGRLGGDVWTGDVVLELMRREKWTGLLATFAGIDKVGHMLGDQDFVLPRAYRTPITLEQAAKVADEQLGRVLDELERRQLLARTLVVVTADHGGQSNRWYFGNGQEGYSGRVENLAPADPPFWIARVRAAGNVKLTAQDSAIRVWLERRDGPKDAVLAAMTEISGMAEVWGLENRDGRWSYRRRFSALERQSEAFRTWAEARYAGLLDSMACETAPDFVGLLADGVGFNTLGDHGGAQETSQRIPLYLAGPGVEAGKLDDRPLRLSDLSALVGERMGLPPLP